MAGKKSFAEDLEQRSGNSVALAFISAEQPTTTNTKAKKQGIKDKRLNLLLNSELLKDLKKIATVKQLSVNELINTVLQDYKSTCIDDINKYNSFYGDKE